MSIPQPTPTLWKNFLSNEVETIINDIRRRLPAECAIEAEDIIYRSIEEVAKMKEPITEPQKLKNVVYQRAKWRLTDFMRKYRTREKSCQVWSQNEHERERAGTDGRGQFNELLKQDFWKYWEAALADLEQRDRDLVTQRCLYGKSRTQLAQKHGMHPATVATRICRGLKRIRKALEANDVGLDYFYC